MVGNVTELPGDSSAPDLVEALPGELEVVALHVDRPALVAHDEDAAIDTANQILGGGTFTWCWGERDIRHSLDGHVERRISEGTAIRSVTTGNRSRCPVELVADERAAVDDVERLRSDPFVVNGDGCEAVLCGAITGDVHDA